MNETKRNATGWRAGRRQALYGMALRLLLLLVLTFTGCSTPPKIIKVIPPRAETPKPPPKPELTMVQRWEALMAKEHFAPTGEKLNSVNIFFNRLDRVDDRLLWGRDDYWATPLETLTAGGGDCEDFAIAKYFTLLNMDIPEQNMRIAYVISLVTKRPHMVLIYGANSLKEPLVLGTRNNFIVPVSQRRDLVPVYSFNNDGYWLADKQNRWRGKRIGDAAGLSLWIGLLRRLQRDEQVLHGGAGAFIKNSSTSH